MSKKNAFTFKTSAKLWATLVTITVKEQWFKNMTDTVQDSFTLYWSGIHWPSLLLHKSSQMLSYWGWTAARTLSRSHLVVSTLFLWHLHWCNCCFKPYYLAYLPFFFTPFLVSLCFLHHPSSASNFLVHSLAPCCSWSSLASAGHAMCSDDLLSELQAGGEGRLSIKSKAAPA